jgi:hypothetical protein
VIKEIIEGKRGKIAICICDYCGKEFRRIYGQVSHNKHNYCSQKCYQKSRAGEFIKCDYCGKDYYEVKSRIKRAKNHFCCDEHVFKYYQKLKEEREKPLKEKRKYIEKLNIQGKKICSKCGKVKLFNEFGPDKKNKDKLSSWCRECQKTVRQIKYNTDPGFKKRVRESAHKCWYKNHEENLEKSRKRHAENKEKEAQQRHNWYEKNKQNRQAYMKVYRKDNAKSLREYEKEYRKDNESYKEWEKQHNKEYAKKNKVRINKYKNSWQKDKLKNDIKFRILRNFSSLMRFTLKDKKNGEHCFKMVNYTVKDLKKHLEAQFEPGMDWDNYGLYGWHIDHIIPSSWFHFTSYEDEGFKQCWALENLQPKWAKDNISKGNRYIG